MKHTACTEPQFLYSRAIPLLPLWAVRPVQWLSACTRVTFTFFLPMGISTTVFWFIQFLLEVYVNRGYWTGTARGYFAHNSDVQKWSVCLGRNMTWIKVLELRKYFFFHIFLHLKGIRYSKWITNCITEEKWFGSMLDPKTFILSDMFGLILEPTPIRRGRWL
jgi:hypothetical protein